MLLLAGIEGDPVQQRVPLAANVCLYSLDEIVVIVVVSQRNCALTKKSPEVLVQALTNRCLSGGIVLGIQVLAPGVVLPKTFPCCKLCERGRGK